MLAFKVTTIGASAGFILTKEAMARLKVQKGDTLYLTEAPDGGYRLTPYDPDFERQMARAGDHTANERRRSVGPYLDLDGYMRVAQRVVVGLLVVASRRISRCKYRDQGDKEHPLMCATICCVHL